MKVVGDRPKPWTRSDLKEFIELYPETDTEFLMERFGRTQSAILCKAHRLCLNKTTEYNIRRGRQTQERVLGKRSFVRKWTQEETAQLLLEYPDSDNSHLSYKYGRTVRSVIGVAKRYGVRKSIEYRRKMASKNSRLGVIARWGIDSVSKKENTNDC